MIYTIVPAEVQHIEAMLPHVRQADVDELWASTMSTPEEALRLGLKMSSECWAGLVDGEPFCVFGVVPGSILGGIGLPWLVGTEGIQKHRRFFLRGSKSFGQHWLETFDSLVNLVDARNTVAIRWLKWMGFQFSPPTPAGPLMLPFHLFELRRA